MLRAWTTRAGGRAASGAFAIAAVLAVSSGRAEAAPPTAPSIATPPPGGHAHAFQPRLEVGNANDPDGDVLRYHFEIFADQALTMLLGASPPEGVLEGAGDLSGWQVSAVLQLGRTYCWHARARDATGADGPWSEPGCFDVTDLPPPAPVILSPADGATGRTLRPDLQIVNAVDPEQDPIDYSWELAPDLTFPLALQWGNRIPAGAGGNTTFRLTADLEEDHHYCWRVRGTGWITSGPYGIGCFTVDVANDPPSVPRPTEPASESASVPVRPTFVWEAAIDPEGGAVAYELEVLDAGHATIGARSALTDTRAQLAEPLVAGAAYSWRVRAVDAQALASPWSDESPFTVDAEPPPDDDDRVAGCCQSSSRASPSAPLLLALASFGLLLRRRGC